MKARFQLAERLSPYLLAVALVACYLPSLFGGLLNWDDPWLIERNTIVQEFSWRSLHAIWFDLSKPTRLVLGAEYLPLRDMSLWLEAALHGLVPWALRSTQLALYIAAMLAFRAVFRRLCATRFAGEAAAWLFALHPAHVESAAWLAGRKDVLALLCVGFALLAYTRSEPRAWLVGLLALGAYLSKSMTIVLPGLLVAVDLWLGRRPKWSALLAAACLAVPATLLHSHVGQLVGMTTEPAGGSRLTAAMTMGPVWLRYLEVALNPLKLSVVQEVPTLTAWTLSSILGWGICLAPLAAALAFRAKRPLALWAFWYVSLVPVSQVLFPLQNRMADRYLFLSVMALALLFGWALDTWQKHPLARWLTGAVVLGSALATVERAVAFSDSVLLFTDATEKTRFLPTAPYQLASALEDRGEPEAAIRAYEEVLRRSRTDEVARRATNNLARLQVAEGRLEAAETLLLAGVRIWPSDPKMLNNLVKVLLRQGKLEAARERQKELTRRFPAYDPERERQKPKVGP